MDSKTAAVLKHYNNGVSYEWERLERHPFEFTINLHYIDKYVKPGDKVLDVGGGPGRYSLHLADKGCEVTLVDLAENNVSFALREAENRNLDLKAFAGDARDISSLVKEKYDHILLMGPLYHLTEEADRIKAVESCLKLLKPHGNLYVAFITLNAGMIFDASEAPELIIDKTEAEFLRCFENDIDYIGPAFTEVFFISQKNVLPFMSRFGLEKLHLLGSESILSPFEFNLNNRPEEIKEKWLDLAVKVCEREELLSYAQHLLYIGRKSSAYA